MKPEILVNFYRSIIESILTWSIMVWFGNMTDADRNSLSRVIRTARRLIYLIYVKVSTVA